MDTANLVEILLCFRRLARSVVREALFKFDFVELSLDSAKIKQVYLCIRCSIILGFPTPELAIRLWFVSFLSSDFIYRN